MARDEGLEETINGDLDGVPGVTQKSMFGGRAWMLNGHLLCAARVDAMLVRLGKGRESWALAIPGIIPTVMGGRPMRGWVWAGPAVYGDDALRRKLVAAAIENVGRESPRRDREPAW